MLQLVEQPSNLETREMKASEREHLIKELMRKTGKGKIACDISLSLSGNDLDKAIARMKIAYPSMEVKS